MERRKLIAANWKMNPHAEAAIALIREVAAAPTEAEIAICPPFIYLAAAGTLIRDSAVTLGAQDCSPHENGAYTGDISAAMLAELGCRYVILGHSERRQYHGETDAQVAAKAKKAVEKGIIPIICVGETLEQREAGRAMDIIKSQLLEAVPPESTGENTVIAYEPVWAIGTGLTARPEQIVEVHEMVRKNLENRLAKGEALRVIYGGSVKADNAQDILSLPDVDGALVGGASLKGKDFLEIAAFAK